MASETITIAVTVKAIVEEIPICDDSLDRDPKEDCKCFACTTIRETKEKSNE